MFINHTNHPVANWGAEQIKAAKIYGDIVDVPFPNIPPYATQTMIHELVQVSVNKLMALHPQAVLCQGEFVYCHALVDRLLNEGIIVLAATSERIVRELYINGMNQKEVYFQFVQFREYYR